MSIPRFDFRPKVGVKLRSAPGGGSSGAGSSPHLEQSGVAIRAKPTMTISPPNHHNSRRRCLFRPTKASSSTDALSVDIHNLHHTTQHGPVETVLLRCLSTSASPFHTISHTDSSSSCIEILRWLPSLLSYLQMQWRGWANRTQIRVRCSGT